MKISKFVPVFSILFLALIAVTDLALYQAVDASDAEGLALLISLPAFFIKIYIMIIPALILFFATFPFWEKTGFVITGILTTIFALTETAFAIYISLATENNFLLLILIIGIWVLGFVVVSLSGRNSGIDKQNKEPENSYKIKLDKTKNEKNTQDKELEKGE